MPFILNQRQVSLFLMGGTAALTTIALVFYLVTGSSPEAVPATAAVTAMFAVLFGLYQWGWEPARYLAAFGIALLAALTIPTDQEFLAALIPVALAVALTDTRWVAGIGLGVLGVLLVRGGLESVYFAPGTLLSYLLALSSLALGSLALDSARHVADRNAAQAQAERERAEQRAAEIERQSSELQAQNARQSELLDLVATLETPAVQLAAGVLLAPVVGTLDTRRAQALMTRLLDAIYRQRARLVILDIAGVPLVDAAVAKALTETVRSVRLLGCEAIVTGVSADVATTLISLEVNLAELHTAATPEDALATVWERRRG